MVSVNDSSIFNIGLSSPLTLYKSLVKEIGIPEEEINRLIGEIHPY